MRKVLIGPKSSKTQMKTVATRETRLEKSLPEHKLKNFTLSLSLGTLLAVLELNYLMARHRRSRAKLLQLMPRLEVN